MRQVPIFSRYELSEYEERQGRILSENQIAVLNNDLTDFLHQRLSLRLDTTNPLQFAQEEAERSGKILFIQWLLDQHQTALQSIADEVQANQTKE